MMGLIMMVSIIAMTRLLNQLLLEGVLQPKAALYCRAVDFIDQSFQTPVFLLVKSENIKYQGYMYSTQFAKPGEGEKIHSRKKQGKSSACDRVKRRSA